MYCNKLVNFTILMPGLEKYCKVQENLNDKNTRHYLSSILKKNYCYRV